MEQDKKEIIESINAIRKELNLEPHPFDYLEAKDVEELRKLRYQYSLMREDYKKGLKEEKPRFGLNLKVGLLIGIPVIAILAIFMFYFSFTKVEERVTGSVLSSNFENKTTTPAIYSFNINAISKGLDNNYLLIIQNNGTENMTFSNILFEDKQVTYNITGDYPPLKPESIIYVKLSIAYSSDEHIITIFTLENKTLVFNTTEIMQQQNVTQSSLPQ